MKRKAHSRARRTTIKSILRLADLERARGDGAVTVPRCWLWYLYDLNPDTVPVMGRAHTTFPNTSSFSDPLPAVLSSRYVP